MFFLSNCLIFKRSKDFPQNENSTLFLRKFIVIFLNMPFSCSHNYIEHAKLCMNHFSVIVFVSVFRKEVLQLARKLGVRMRKKQTMVSHKVVLSTPHHAVFNFLL